MSLKLVPIASTSLARAPFYSELTEDKDGICLPVHLQFQPGLFLDDALEVGHITHNHHKLSLLVLHQGGDSTGLCLKDQLSFSLNWALCIFSCCLWPVLVSKREKVGSFFGGSKPGLISEGTFSCLEIVLASTARCNGVI